MIGSAEQGGLGLPDRDYYTKQDDKSKQLFATNTCSTSRRCSCLRATRQLRPPTKPAR